MLHVEALQTGLSHTQREVCRMVKLGGFLGFGSGLVFRVSWLCLGLSCGVCPSVFGPIKSQATRCASEQAS